MKIFEKLLHSFHNNLPFVVYRKPNKNKISGFFMNVNSLNFTTNFTEKGFVFAPFNEKQKAVLFPLEKSEFIFEELILNTTLSEEKTLFETEVSRENHIQLVEKTIKEIDKSDLQKVVVSRKIEIKLSSIDIVSIFKKILQNYTNAFAYVWFHPKVGLWFGATPETLLQIKDVYFKTMSLAGTQIYNSTENVVWKNKEFQEQQLVTDFIERQLKGISSNLKIDKRETIKAGNLLHLRTKVEGDLNTTADLKSLIRALHPTPAVCGLPREKAHKFIVENENYERTFYTGFLGELNLQDLKSNVQSSQLYVNLRCMQVKGNSAFIYVGGGITKESNAEKEWEETVSKTKTMRRVL